MFLFSQVTYHYTHARMRTCTHTHTSYNVCNGNKSVFQLPLCSLFSPDPFRNSNQMRWFRFLIPQISLCVYLFHLQMGQGGGQLRTSLFPRESTSQNSCIIGGSRQEGKEMLLLPFATFGLFPRTSVKSHSQCFERENRTGQQHLEMSLKETFLFLLLVSYSFTVELLRFGKFKMCVS